MNDVRMKIAAGATVLGLGGLAGFALGTNDAPTSAAVKASANPDPKVKTRVIHRRIEVHPKSRAVDASDPGTPAVEPQATPTPAVTPSPVTPVSATPDGSSAPPPVSTHTSGSGSGANATDDDRGQSENEGESEGTDD